MTPVIFKLNLLAIYMLQLIFISVNFGFSFVLNSLTYITIPQNNGKIKINWNEKITTYTRLFILYKTGKIGTL